MGSLLLFACRAPVEDQIPADAEAALASCDVSEERAAVATASAEFEVPVCLHAVWPSEGAAERRFDDELAEGTENRHIDRVNRPTRPLPAGRLSHRAAGLEALSLALAGLAAAWWLGPVNGAIATAAVLLLLVYMPLGTFVQIVPASVSGLGAVQVVMIALYAPHVASEVAATLPDKEAQVLAFTTFLAVTAFLALTTFVALTPSSPSPPSPSPSPSSPSSPPAPGSPPASPSPAP